MSPYNKENVMSMQVINSYQNTFQDAPFIETNKSSSFLPKKPQRMNFLLSLITSSEKLRKKHNDDHFPEDKYWQCLKCRAMNLTSIWRCAYCGKSR